MANPLFPTDTIKDVADSLGITTLSADSAKQLAMDVEYRIQEVVQEALKFMRHSKRTVLSPVDISNALKSLNIEVCPFIHSTNSLAALRIYLVPSDKIP
jgi:transcription initiation factor TFIID subunit 6